MTLTAFAAIIAPTTTTAPTTPKVTKKGWFADPTGHHKLRFHDGQAWTDHATHFGPVPCQGCGHAA